MKFGFITKGLAGTKPLLLAAIWDYIAVYVDDNEIGAETIQCWISGKMTPNDKGVLSQDIGASAAGKNRFSLDVPHDSANDHQTAYPTPSSEPVANTHVSVPGQIPLQSDPIIQNIYGGMVFSPGTQIQNVHYSAQPHGGTSVFEMQGLRSDYYSLFVLDGETLTDDHFSMSKRCVFSAGTEEDDQKWLRTMGDDVKQMLLSTPAVFTMKRKEKKPVQNRCLFLVESPTYAFKKRSSDFLEAIQAFPDAGVV